MSQETATTPEQHHPQQPSNDPNTTPNETETEKESAATATPTTSESPPPPPPTCTSKRLCAFYWEHEFLILILLAIGLARAYPRLGADFLQPAITATYLAVIFIFLLAGLGLQTSEFRQAAFRYWHFNAVVQAFNFGGVSGIVYAVSRALIALHIVSEDLADGMVVCATLPMTISMVNVLTKAGNGDEAAAIFNSAMGNLIGVFLSPVLILAYLGVTGGIDVADVLVKLILRVVVPVLVGQVLQRIAVVNDFVKRHKVAFKYAQQYALIFIVYTVFCRTFSNDDNKSSIGDIFLMILFQFLLLATVMILAWYLLQILFPKSPRLRVMGLFGCTHKTVAIGVPLINAIYEDNPAVGLYTLPLLIWHPLQLIVGSLLAPYLAKFVTREEERLGLLAPTDDEKATDGTTSMLPVTVAEQPTTQADQDAIYADSDAPKSRTDEKGAGTNV